MEKSQSIGKLSEALSKLQGEVTDAFKSSNGRNHTYADLEAVLKIARPLLKKHELAVSQLPQNSDGNGVHLHTILMHSSGEWLSSSMFMPIVKITSSTGKEVINAAQQLGSAITYARRYSLTSLLGFTQSDDDDDAESLTQNVAPKFKQVEAETKTAPLPKIGHDKALILLELIGKAGYTEQKIHEHYGVTRLLDMNTHQYENCKMIMEKKISGKEETK